MTTTVTEIAEDVYRLCFYSERADFEYCQFLVTDDEPMLLHTGMKAMFASTLEAVGHVINPATLRYIGFSHVEADECGAINDWFRVAPRAEAVCSFIGATVNLNDLAHRPPRALVDDEVIETGRHRIRFLSTPHVPHCWDAGLFFDETGRTLFTSDLFLQNHRTSPVIDSDIVGRAHASMLENLAGPFAHDMPYTPRTDAVLERLAALDPVTLAVMHGSSYRGNGRAALMGLSAVVRDLLG